MRTIERQTHERHTITLTREKLFELLKREYPDIPEHAELLSVRASSPLGTATLADQLVVRWVDVKKDDDARPGLTSPDRCACGAPATYGDSNGNSSCRACMVHPPPTMSEMSRVVTKVRDLLTSAGYTDISVWYGKREDLHPPTHRLAGREVWSFQAKEPANAVEGELVTAYSSEDADELIQVAERVNRPIPDPCWEEKAGVTATIAIGVMERAIERLGSAGGIEPAYVDHTRRILAEGVESLRRSDNETRSFNITDRVRLARDREPENPEPGVIEVLRSMRGEVVLILGPDIYVKWDNKGPHSAKYQAHELEKDDGR